MLILQLINYMLRFVLNNPSYLVIRYDKTQPVKTEKRIMSLGLGHTPTCKT